MVRPGMIADDGTGQRISDSLMNVAVVVESTPRRHCRSLDATNDEPWIVSARPASVLGSPPGQRHGGRRQRGDERALRDRQRR